MTAELASPSFPVEFDVGYPQRLSRLLIFVKWLLAIPHTIVLYALAVVSRLFTVSAWFAILFSGRCPKGLFDFSVGAIRWTARVSCCCATSIRRSV
jgi:hypothetical protein